jgi:hypothetical protein
MARIVVAVKNKEMRLLRAYKLWEVQESKCND